MSALDEAKPPRPSLPPLLLAALALWAVTALLWPAALGAPGELHVTGALVGAVAVAALAALCVRRHQASVLLAGALGAAAALSLVGLGALAQASASSAAIGLEGPWTCTLATDARPSEFGWQADARAQCGQGAPVKVRLNMPAAGEGLLCGDRLVVAAPMRGPSAASRERWWIAGMAGSLTAREVVRAEGGEVPLLAPARRRAIEALGKFGGEQAGLLQALVCGFRATIGQSGTYERFKAVGLAHLVAVSGAHLSIVSLFAAQGLCVLRVGRRATAAVMALFLAGYVGFTGMPVSALRAAVMAATGLLALVADRRASTLNALGGCIALFVGLDAPCALSVSFALSAGSTLGIVLLAPLFTTAVAPLPRRVRMLLADPLILTAASAVATQPYAAALFSQVPLLGPVSNVVATPLFTVACVVGFVAVLIACVAPGAAPAAIAGASVAAAPLDWAVQLLSQIPGSCLPVDLPETAMVCLSVLLVGVLWARWPTVRPKVAAGALAAALTMGGAALFVAPSHAEDEIVMLDVGQGDAFLVRSEGAAVLVDTGNRDGLLREACARQGIRALNGVVVSHPDDDHCGSLAALGDVARISELIVAADLLECPCDSCGDLREVAAGEAYPLGIAGLEVGDRIRCGRFTLEAIWPERFSDEGGNGDSLSLLCSYDGDGDGSAEWTALFCGDAEVDELRAMAPLLPADGIDVLKVGHHGSKRSLDAALAASLSPGIALVSVGESNRYGHPSGEVLAALEAVGACVLCSDEAGDVSVTFSMEKLTVRAQSEMGGR